MKLYETPPDVITVGRRRYRVDLDFRNVLRMMETLDREDLLQEAREYRALRCVCRHPPRKYKPLFVAVLSLLFPGAKSESGGPKLTSFEQDADLIRAAFLQAYGINLYHDRLHWLEFISLLHSIPEGSRYAEIVSIRARPMPEATKYNEKEREWLAKAKAIYAVQLTEKEREASLQAGLHSMTLSLLELAKRGKPDEE